MAVIWYNVPSGELIGIEYLFSQSTLPVSENDEDEELADLPEVIVSTEVSEEDPTLFLDVSI